MLVFLNGNNVNAHAAQISNIGKDDGNDDGNDDDNDDDIEILSPAIDVVEISDSEPKNSEEWAEAFCKIK